jgi:adenylosuccinate synthase
MARVVVALSGPVASGKSTLAERLHQRYGAHVVRTQDVIEDLAQERLGRRLAERRALQEYGDSLDGATDGTWVASAVEPLLHALPDRTVVVVDAVRIQEQVDALRGLFGRGVVHVHLHAPLGELGRRYGDKRGLMTELADYDAVRSNATESRVPGLADTADIAIDTSRCTPADVEVRAAARLGLLPGPGEDLVDVLVGGQYGSEGKGNIAFFLAPEYDLLVRVGGPNAGHKVPTVPPTTHRSLPSGTLANPRARLLIGPGAVLSVPTLLEEIRRSGVDPARLAVDPRAMLIDDADVAAEVALVGAIGSTGQGVGAATARRISGRSGGVRLAGSAPELKPYLRDAAEVLDDAYARNRRIMLEGTQGTALSLIHGPHPHVTSRDTTAAGCLAEAGINPRRVRRVVVVCRTYPIRVGGPSGPIAQEIEWEEVADRAGLPLAELLGTEVGSVTHRQRRVGEFDWALLRTAAELNGATDIALTFADYHRPRNRGAYRYDQLDRETIRFVEEVESVAGSPVSLIATRFAARSVIDRREWRGHLLDRPDA